MTKQDAITLCLELIATDLGTQMRAEVNEAVVTDYAALWSAGNKFDAVEVFHDGKQYILADGFHRYFGAKRANRTSIPCYVRQGTLRDAILFAVGANQSHGLRRTNDDKRVAVRRLLDDEEWVAWSDHRIAEQAGVSQRFVSEVRGQLRTVLSSPAAVQADKPRKGKDGKARKPPQSRSKQKNKGKTNPQSDAPAGVCPKGGDHEPDEDGDCRKCFEPGLKSPKKGKKKSGGDLEAISDHFKIPVPASLIDVFGIRPEVRSLMASISEVKGRVKQIAELESGGFIDAQEFTRLMDTAHSLLRFAMPYTECAKCKRKADKSCPTCKGRGWVNEALFKTAFSDPDKAWLESRK